MVLSGFLGGAHIIITTDGECYTVHAAEVFGMTDSFWAGGAGEYEAGLRDHYTALLRDLRSKLEKCTEDLKRTKIQSEISQTEAEYKFKLKEIDNLLF